MEDKLKVGMRVRRMCEACSSYATQTITSVPDPIRKGALVSLDCNGGHAHEVARYQLEEELAKGKADTV